MTSSYLIELDAALKSGRADKIALKRHLQRLSSAVESRITSPDETSTEFIKNAVALVDKLDKSVYPTLRFNCFSSAVPYLYAQGTLEAALLAARGMHSSAQYTRRKELIRKAESFLGAIHRTLGNVADAVIHLQRALLLANELADLRAQASALNNLGSVFQEVGLYKEAFPCYERAISICDSEPEIADEKSAGLYNLSQLLLKIGDRAGANDAIHRSFEILSEPRTPFELHSRTLRESNFVQLALEFGNLEEAEFHMRACHRYAAKSGSKPSQFLAKVASGLCNVRLGSPDVGLALLEAALNDSAHLERIDFRADALVALTSACEALHRPNEALKYLRLLMQHIVARREFAIDALLSSHQASVTRSLDGPEFLAFKYREAKLQAECAEFRAREERLDMLERLAMTATLKDDASGLHGYRVGKLSSLVAAAIGWPADRCYLLENAARLHDIGKVGIPDHILLSSENLEQTQREFMQSHTMIGASLLGKSGDPELTVAAEIAHSHHEHWNGQGYPSGISHERIPIHARIVALADVFDALTHGRPYARAWSREQALTEIRSLKGTQFDPSLVEVFLKVVNDLGNAHANIDSFLGAAGNSSPFFLARKHIEETIARARHDFGPLAQKK